MRNITLFLFTGLTTISLSWKWPIFGDIFVTFFSILSIWSLYRAFTKTLNPFTDQEKSFFSSRAVTICAGLVLLITCGLGIKYGNIYLENFENPWAPVLDLGRPRFLTHKLFKNVTMIPSAIFALSYFIFLFRLKKAKKI